MPRVDDYLALVDSPSRQGLTPGHPADDALISLLAHVAFSDGDVDDEELEFLKQVLPGRDDEDLREWAISAGSAPLDFQAVATALPSVEERWAGLRFAARMAWKDGVLVPEERVLLTRLVQALELPDGALDRVLAEMQGRAREPVNGADVERALAGMKWGSVQHGGGELRSDLAVVVPKGSTIVARIGVDSVEVLGFFHEGLAGRFLEGMAFLPWDDIVTYSRVPVLGASVQIHTESGRRWSLVDHRLIGLATFFDHLFRPEGEERPKAKKPVKVEHVRGE